MAPASNTPECFEEFTGQKLKGVLFGRLPRTAHDIAVHCKTLVFEDGRGLTINDNGSYWIEKKEDVAWAVENLRKEAERHQRTVEECIRLAG